MSHSGRSAALGFLFLTAVSGATFQNLLFFGGNGVDVTKGVATDGSYLYVLGETTSTNLPNASGRNQGGGDLFVFKFDPRTKAVVWSTYVGGSGRETAGGIAVDARGTVWIAGTTASADFPVTPDALQRTFGGGGSDAFVAQVSSRGTGIAYATFLGGSGAESNALFAMDRAGAVYVAGTTTGSFPARTGSVQATFGGGASDVFLVKLAAAATQVEYATYLGGSAADSAAAMVVDDAGTAYLTGSTASTNFPVSDNAYRKQNAGATDAFAARINAGGTGLLFGTYLGGTGADSGTGIAPSAGGAYVAMTTASRGLFTSPGAFLTSFSGGPSDGYLARLSPDGSQVTTASYFGGPGEDTLGAVVLRANGEPTMLFRSTSEYWGEAGAFAAARPRASADGVTPQPYDLKLDTNASASDVNHYEVPEQCRALSASIDALLSAFGLGAPISGGSMRVTNPGACTPNTTVAGTAEESTASLEYPEGGFRIQSFGMSPLSRPQGTVGDPVATASGELYDTMLDLDLGGPMHFGFARYYGSFLGGAGFQGALGSNWMHNFDQWAEVSGNSATVMMFQGKRLAFTRGSASGPWQLTTATPNGYQLVSDGSGLHLLSYASRNVFHFNPVGQLLKIEDRNGNALTVTPGPFGPAQVADGLGRSLTFTYSGSKLTRVADQAGRSIAFGYTGANLTSVTGLNGRATTYSYAAGAREGLLLSTTQPAGNRILLNAFDDAGRVTRQSDSRNHSATIAYGQGQTTITDAAGVVTRHNYGSGVDLAGMADEQGSAAIQTDANGRRTGFTDKLGNKTSFTFHVPTGYMASFTDAAGNTAAYTWTAQQQGAFPYYNLTEIRYAGDITEQFAYDAKGNLLTETLRDGSTRKYTYNSRGQVLTVTSAADGVTTLVYNDDGTLRSAQAASGVRTEIAYDTAKQPIRVTRPESATREYSYTPSGRLARSVDELGAATVHQYDSNERLAGVTDAFGNTTQHSFDGDGRMVSVTDRTGGTTELGYNAVGRLAAKKLPSGRTASFSYTGAGKVASVSDELGRAAEYTYTAEGFLASQTDALGRTTKFTVDALGRMTKITAASGAAATAQYNGFGLRTSVTDALGRTTEIRYDSRGNVVESRAPGSAIVKWERDASTRATRIVDPNGNAWAMAYDAAGRITKRVDPLERAVGYGYNARGRVSSIALAEGALELAYDAAGRLVAKTYSDGTADQFERDKEGRVVTANGVEFAYDAEGRMTKSNGLAIERDADGRLAAVTYAEGKTVRYTYDARGRLTGVADWAGGGLTMNYNAGGELIEVARLNGVNGKYEYNADGHVTRLKEGSLSTIALGRNAAGEIVEAERTIPTPAAAVDGEQEFAYDAAHQVVGTTYDKLGRVVSDGRRSYQWNLASQLTGVKEGEAEAAFAYDAFGGLTSWTRGETRRTFVQNYAITLPSVAVERRDDADAAYYVHTPEGFLLYRIAAADDRRCYYHFDEMGNTTFVTDDAGAVVESYGVTPYGESAGSAEAENLFVFQGAMGVVRVAPGLYHMRARYYDANSARFLSPDPVVDAKNPAAASPYAYAAGNPLLRVDPDGRWPQCYTPWGCVKAYLGFGNEEPARAPEPAPAPEPPPAPQSYPEPYVNPNPWSDGEYTVVGPTPAKVVELAPVAPLPLVAAPTPLPLAGDSAYQAYCSPGLGVPTAAGLASNAGGGSGVVALGGGNIVAVGGANIVALGGGNFTVNGVAFRVEGGRIIANGGGNIVALGGGNIVALGGANIVALGGGNFSVNGVPVETNGGQIIAVGGANFSGFSPASLVGLNGLGVINGNGSTVIAWGGGH